MLLARVSSLWVLWAGVGTECVVSRRRRAACNEWKAETATTRDAIADTKSSATA